MEKHKRFGIQESIKCKEVNPATGNVCTMGSGHFGPHKVGGPYNTTEEFITPCVTKHRTCDFHHNSDGRGKHWEECIHCGDRRKISEKLQAYHNWIDSHMSSHDIRERMGEIREQLFQCFEDMCRKLAELETQEVDFQEEDILVVFETLNDQESAYVARVQPGGAWIRYPDDESWVSREEMGDMLLLTILEKLEEIDRERLKEETENGEAKQN